MGGAGMQCRFSLGLLVEFSGLVNFVLAYLLRGNM